MSTAKDRVFIVEDEYLKGELSSDIKHEYVEGQVFAMAGASKAHRMIAGNTFTAFSLHLKGKPCDPNMGDARIASNGNYFYPDIVVDCNENKGFDSLYAEKPVLIVEVLSRTTRRMDKGPKLLNYFNIPTIEEYVLIEQDIISIEVFRRCDNWFPHSYCIGDEVYFKSIDLALPVEEIYLGIQNQDMVEFLRGRNTD